MFLNIKNKNILALTAVLFGLLIGGSAFLYFFTPEKHISVPMTHELFSNANELTNQYDLIIIGTPEKDFRQCSPTIVYNDAGRYEDFYTLTDIKELKIIKGDTNLKTVPVLQGAALIDSYSFKNQKDLLILDGYSVMQKGKKYLLFLKKTDNGNYSIASVNQGKFNIDSLDNDEKSIENQDKQYRELKHDVLSKYADKLN